MTELDIWHHKNVNRGLVTNKLGKDMDYQLHPSLHAVFKALLIMLVSAASAERSFSILRRLKTQGRRRRSGTSGERRTTFLAEYHPPYHFFAVSVASVVLTCDLKPSKLQKCHVLLIRLSFTHVVAGVIAIDIAKV